MTDTADNPTTSLDPSTWLDRYGDGLYRYAFSRLRDREAAEEVVQETFVSALKAIGQYSGRGSEGAWLTGILKRKVIDFVRKRNRTLSGSDDDSTGDPSEMLFDQTGHWRSDPRLFGHDPAEAIQSREFRAALNQCLDGIPAKQRDVFTLRELEDLSSEEICKELDITASNLWVLLHRARLRLATCLKSKWPTGEAVS